MRDALYLHLLLLSVLLGFTLWTQLWVLLPLLMAHMGIAYWTEKRWPQRRLTTLLVSGVAWACLMGGLVQGGQATSDDVTGGSVY